MLYVKQYPSRPYNRREILRYMSVASDSNDASVHRLIDECIDQCEKDTVFKNKVCFAKFDLNINKNIISIGEISFENENYAKKLKACDTAIVFAATVGIGIDRLIEKYIHVSPAKALAFQAIGAERIESLCDTFCEEISKDSGFNPLSRFSPGYSGISLDIQKDIFRILNCEKNIGLTLCDSMLMSPSKSVTAIIGIEKKGK